MSHQPVAPEVRSWAQPESQLQSKTQTSGRPLDAAAAMRADNKQRLSAPTPVDRPRHALYASSWAIAGLLAGGYVVTALINQESNGTMAARTEPGGRPSADLADIKSQAEFAQLQRTVGNLETDVARLKSSAAQHDDREKQLSSRVAVVETRIEQFSTTIAQVALPAQPNARAVKAIPIATPTKAASIQTGTIPTPLPAPQPLPETAVMPRELVATRHATAATVQADPANPAAAVLLARGPSLDALRLSWSLLNERHRTALKSLEPRVVQVEPGSYQLLAGPIANPADALKVCVTLKARGVACQAADFKGDGL